MLTFESQKIAQPPKPGSLYLRGANRAWRPLGGGTGGGGGRRGERLGKFLNLESVRAPKMHETFLQIGTKQKISISRNYKTS